VSPRGHWAIGGWAPVDALTPGGRDRAEDEVAATLEEWRAASDWVDPFDTDDDDDEDAPALPPARSGWHREAACRGLLGTPEWAAAFFPTDGDPDNHGAAAKAVCATCPVWRDCLTEAVDRRERTGIWGGAGGAQLRTLARARRRGADAWEVALADHRVDLDDIAAGRRPAGATNANGAGATCGLAVTYSRGCRCEACCWGMRFARNRPPVGRVHLRDTVEAA
jgi:hypothetical protein